MPTGYYVRTAEHRELKRKIALDKGYGKWMIGRKGKLCPNFKGIPACIDCGVKVSRHESKRCWKCNGKIHRGKNSPWYGVRRLGKDSPNWQGKYSKSSRYKRLQTQKRRYGLDIGIVQLVYEDNIKQYGTLTCYLCLKSVKFGDDHLEHKHPISRGGTNNYNNLAVSCARCNKKKHNKTVEEYNGTSF